MHLRFWGLFLRAGIKKHPDLFCSTIDGITRLRAQWPSCASVTTDIAVFTSQVIKFVFLWSFVCCSLPFCHASACSLIFCRYPRYCASSRIRSPGPECQSRVLLQRFEAKKSGSRTGFFTIRLNPVTELSPTREFLAKKRQKNKKTRYRFRNPLYVRDLASGDIQSLLKMQLKDCRLNTVAEIQSELQKVLNWLTEKDFQAGFQQYIWHLMS